ncbi:Emi1 protein [Saccharomycopsis crataegensis]|uniref:Emi1 protein n=1 Tax=Saccharomycopsis crataegensis TaxID=43959 RepID=A0AAV5QGZ9_9ASCO|nr:Emi1 protein [Saccharomycopsis crataegensis]
MGQEHTDDLSDVLNIFKDAIESPADINNQRKEDTVPVRKDPKLGQYPETMSCTTAFDELFGCYSVGGQFNNYYRYGELNPCSDAYEKFLFCVKNSTFGSKSEEEKKAEIQNYFKKQLMMTKAKGSSEDVWQIRK